MITCFDDFFAAYVECALWSSTDDSRPDGDESLGTHYGPEHITKKSLAFMRKDCEAFYRLYSKCWAHSPTFPKVGHKPYTCSDAGHDFWLTRNGHGAGFWDCDNIGSFAGYDSAELLTEAAKACGEVNLHVYRKRIYCY